MQRGAVTASSVMLATIFVALISFNSELRAEADHIHGAPRAGTLTLNRLDDWDSSKDGSPKTYRGDGLTITLSTEGVTADDLAPTLTVKARDGERGKIVGEQFSMEGVTSATFGIARLDPGNPVPQVILQSYSGGMHCCDVTKILELTGKGWKVIKVGGEDAIDRHWGKPEGLLADIANDGQLEIIVSDIRFDYAFTSYNGSWLPPRVFEVRNGKLLDVSGETNFSKIFRADMNAARKGCLQHDNASCGAFVADATRLGKFDAAWTTMLQNYDKKTSWAYPFSPCEVARVGYVCPVGTLHKFSSFPDALAYFLAHADFVSRMECRQNSLPCYPQD